MTSISLHIDRLILDGVAVAPADRAALLAAVETELTRLLTEGGVADGILAGGAVPFLRGASLTLTADGSAASLGARLAQAVYQSLGPGEPHKASTPRLDSAALAETPLPTVPAVAREATQRAGEPLDPATRALMEARLGHDLSDVRVHTGEQAAHAARAMDAVAFTLGRDVVFDRGEYAPIAPQGRDLLAHELTHVVQQERGIHRDTVQRQPRPLPAAVDANAQRILDLAQDAGRPIAERAVAVVRAIINQYYPSDAAKISNITYREAERGLDITYSGRGGSTTGNIAVGRYFVENTTQRHFARRVAQVRHEIEHVEQERSGMTGRRRQDEREFIAFYHEALFTEPAGAGRIQHATRVQLIDAALGYYYCLSDELRQSNQSRRDELTTRRAEAVTASGHSDLGDAPTSCRRRAH